jgi:glyceraldehyde 3-phosphate dehydrogenase
VDLVANLEKSGVTADYVKSALKAASEGGLKGILGYSEDPLVSCDFNGNKLSSIVDAPVTYVVGDMVKVLSWYDNEAGYSERLVDLAELVAAKL